MEIKENDLKVSETFLKVSQHLDKIKHTTEENLKIELSDTQEVNLLFTKYSDELKIKFKYNKFLSSPDDIKKFLLDNFPNAKISNLKLIRLGFINIPLIFLISSFMLNLLINGCLTLFSINISLIIQLIISFVLSIILCLFLYPSNIKSTKGHFN